MPEELTVSEPSRFAPLSRLTLLLVALTALGLAAVPVTGCHGSAPSLLLVVEDPSEVAPTQLRVTVRRDGVDPEVVVRPETPASPLPPGQSLRLHLPLETIGTRVGIAVEGLLEGEVVAEAQGEIEIPDGRETELPVRLKPSLEACSPENCETGCCVDGVCVTSEEEAAEACGPPEEFCVSCDPLRSDGCVSGACSCGEGPACDSSEACLEGACVLGQPCEIDDDCGPLPEGGCMENTGICTDGLCETQPKVEGASCEDGNICTEDDVCDGEGACVTGTPVVCEPGSNPCLIYNEVCSPISGCSRPVADGAACPSPDVCVRYTCQEGTCTMSGPACEPGQSCCRDLAPNHCVEEPPTGETCLATPF